MECRRRAENRITEARRKLNLLKRKRNNNNGNNGRTHKHSKNMLANERAMLPKGVVNLLKAHIEKQVKVEFNKQMSKMMSKQLSLNNENPYKNIANQLASTVITSRKKTKSKRPSKGGKGRKTKPKK